MEPEEFERLKRAVALELARKTMEGADLSRGDENLTEEQRSALDWIEMLYNDGEITYGELWRIALGRPLTIP